VSWRKASEEGQQFIEAGLVAETGPIYSGDGVFPNRVSTRGQS
jgi:hypothetical protein